MLNEMVADYFAERECLEILEHECGFLFYRFLEDGEICELHSIYTDPEKRKTGVGSHLLDKLQEVCKSGHAKYIMARIDLRANEPEVPLFSSLKYGFRLHSADNDRIFIKLEVK